MRKWLQARPRATAVVMAVCCAGGGVAAVVVAAAPGVPAAAAAAAGSGYVPLGPVRVLNTTNGTGGHSGPVGPNSTISLQVDGVAGVPASGVTAVVLNVTAVKPTAASFVTVYPDGGTRPDVSNLNFTAGKTVPNLVVAPVGTNGKVDFYNHAGSVTLTADLAGYYATTGGSQYATAGPVRVLNTTNGTGGHTGPVGPNSTISLQVDGVDGVPPTGVTAVVLNVTAVKPTAAGYVTVWPDGKARPDVSNLNFTAGQTVPNLVVAPVGSDGKVDFYNHAGSVTLAADLAGYYYAAGSALATTGPVRVLNTVTGVGGHTGPVGPNATISLQVDGVAGVPASGVSAVVLNVTAVKPTAAGYVTVYPDGGTRPDVSNLNFTAGLTVPNLAVVPVGADGKVDFYNHAGSVTLTADLAGYYLAGGPSWGNAIEVPGTAALNTGGLAEVGSVSCPSAGNCTAGGQYSAGSNNGQAFVADEVNSTWHNAIEIPGTAALNTGEGAFVSALSCATAGNCAAVGNYLGSSGELPFVADEANGTWGDAIEIPGIATLAAGLNASADVASVSCTSAGNCAAGGSYFTNGQSQAFVVSEVNGNWGNAIEAPGTATLNTGGGANVLSVSCGSAGNCAAGGAYTDSSGRFQAFVVSEVNGNWGNAMEVPGTATLNTGGSASVASVSCPSAGNCSAGGEYAVSSSSGPSPTQAFVVSEVSGTWGTAIEVPGILALNTGGAAVVNSVSCPTQGNCAATGELAITSGVSQVFAVSEVSGTWGTAVGVPGTASSFNGGVEFAPASCGSAGNCAAVGADVNPGRTQPFAVNEVSGTWGEPVQVPGLNTSHAAVASVSCPSAGSCVAGGSYADSAGKSQAFVVSQN